MGFPIVPATTCDTTPACTSLFAVKRWVIECFFPADWARGRSHREKPRRWIRSTFSSFLQVGYDCAHRRAVSTSVAGTAFFFTYQMGTFVQTAFDLISVAKINSIEVPGYGNHRSSEKLLKR